MTRLRLIVADDSPRFLRKFISVLQVEFDVVATAVDGRTALDLVYRHKPDAVVLDLSMPGLNGIEVTRVRIPVKSISRPEGSRSAFLRIPIR